MRSDHLEAPDLQRVSIAVRAASDKKADRVVVLDVSELLAITDHFVICSGGNDRQVRTIADAVIERLKDEAGSKPLRTEGAREAGWILLDYGDLVVHVFLTEVREYYDLERLWKDAPRVELAGTGEALA